jgi:hypothetical protein
MMSHCEHPAEHPSPTVSPPFCSRLAARLAGDCWGQAVDEVDWISRIISRRPEPVRDVSFALICESFCECVASGIPLAPKDRRMHVTPVVPRSSRMTRTILSRATEKNPSSFRSEAWAEECLRSRQLSELSVDNASKNIQNERTRKAARKAIRNS